MRGSFYWAAPQDGRTSYLRGRAVGYGGGFRREGGRRLGVAAYLADLPVHRCSKGEAAVCEATGCDRGRGVRGGARRWLDMICRTDIVPCRLARDALRGETSGRVPKWTKGTDCKSVIRRFESDLGLFPARSDQSFDHLMRVTWMPLRLGSRAARHHWPWWWMSSGAAMGSVVRRWFLSLSRPKSRGFSE